MLDKISMYKCVNFEDFSWIQNRTYWATNFMIGELDYRQAMSLKAFQRKSDISINRQTLNFSW